MRVIGRLPPARPLLGMEPTPRPAPSPGPHPRPARALARTAPSTSWCAGTAPNQRGHTGPGSVHLFWLRLFSWEIMFSIFLGWSGLHASSVGSRPSLAEAAPSPAEDGDFMSSSRPHASGFMSYPAPLGRRDPSSGAAFGRAPGRARSARFPRSRYLGRGFPAVPASPEVVFLKLDVMLNITKHTFRFLPSVGGTGDVHRLPPGEPSGPRAPCPVHAGPAPCASSPRPAVTAPPPPVRFARPPRRKPSLCFRMCFMEGAVNSS